MQVDVLEHCSIVCVCVFCPVAGQSVEEFMSPTADSNLTLKLTQLHTFFSDHLATYKEQCVIPDPPYAFILGPQTIQVYTHRNHTLDNMN